MMHEIADLKARVQELEAGGCYWDAQPGESICPKHGGTIGQCPIPDHLLTPRATTEGA